MAAPAEAVSLVKIQAEASELLHQLRVAKVGRDVHKRRAQPISELCGRLGRVGRLAGFAGDEDTVHALGLS